MLAFLALLGAPYTYDISSLRVNNSLFNCNTNKPNIVFEEHHGMARPQVVDSRQSHQTWKVASKYRMGYFFLAHSVYWISSHGQPSRCHRVWSWASSCWYLDICVCVCTHTTYYTMLHWVSDWEWFFGRTDTTILHKSWSFRGDRIQWNLLGQTAVSRREGFPMFQGPSHLQRVPGGLVVFGSIKPPATRWRRDGPWNVGKPSHLDTAVREN